MDLEGCGVGGGVEEWAVETRLQTKEKKNTEGEAADNGDETPSKPCSSQ